MVDPEGLVRGQPAGYRASPPGGRNAGDMYVDTNGALWVWGRGNATTGTMAWHRASFAN